MAFDKDDVKKVQIIHLSKNTTSIVPLDHLIEIKDKYSDNAMYHLKMRSHKHNLLIFISQKKASEYSDYTTPHEIIYFENFDLSNQKNINFENTMEGKSFQGNENFAPHYIEKIGYTDSDMFPIILGDPFGYKSSQEVSFLNIDFEKLTARWKTTKEKEFISFKENFTDDIDQENSTVNALTYKNNKLIYFKISSSFKYAKYGAGGGVHLYEIKDPLDTNYESSVLYQCDFEGLEDEESEKLYGRSAKFTSNQKFAIILPNFEHDPWGKREKLFDIDKNELISIELPRGFSKHHVFDANNTCFISFGQNSKKEYLITILKEEV